MILLPCAWCGPRDATEFQQCRRGWSRAPTRRPRPPRVAGYLYLRANPCGWTTETWYHRMGCRRYIKVERHTETNEVRAVYAGKAAG